MRGIFTERATTLAGGGSPAIGSYPLITGGTWAVVGAATPAAGSLARVTNIGRASAGSIWLYGTRWAPLGGSLILTTLGAPVASIANVETIVFQTLLPINSWQVNDTLRIPITTTKSGTTDTLTFKVRIGTAGTTADATVRTANILNAAAVSGGFMQDIKLISATSAQFIGNAAAGSGSYGGSNAGAAVAAVSISDASTNALYVTVTVQSSSTNDTVGVQGGQIQLVTP